MSKKESLVLNLMRQSAIKRCKIPNANNGRAYMSCIILNQHYHSITHEGINKYEMTLNHGTIHVEVDALMKLPVQKKRKSIHLAVYTTNKDGSRLLMSKCCDNCIKSIHVISKRKNYVVKNIYFINEMGDLSKL